MYSYVEHNDIEYMVLSIGVASIGADPLFKLKRSTDGRWIDSNGAAVASGLEKALEQTFRDINIKYRETL